MAVRDAAAPSSPVAVDASADPSSSNAKDDETARAADAGSHAEEPQGSEDAGRASTTPSKNVDAGPEAPPGPPPLTNQVGLPCDSDSDCPVFADIALVCIANEASSPFGTVELPGGPQGGYCSFPCTEQGSECQTLVDANSGCSLLDEAGNGFCVGLCQPGPSSNLETRLKCGDNRAQACVQFSENDAVGACSPLCTSNEECGTGRFCDPGGFGLCVDQPPQGGGVGAPCSVETEVVDCASGICLEYQVQGEVVASFCSANCILGELDMGCGHALESTAERDSACLARRFATGAPGDLGLCIELCDVSSDCAQFADNWICEPFQSEQLQALGRAGSCVPEAVVNPPGAGDTPPDAGAGQVLVLPFP